MDLVQCANKYSCCSFLTLHFLRNSFNSFIKFIAVLADEGFFEEYINGYFEFVAKRTGGAAKGWAGLVVDQFKTRFINNTDGE